jgi:3-deoxy-7-phosphoheptulonate synthase
LAVELKELGAGVLRGGVYKARSSPFTFRGLGEHGLEILAEASALTGLPIVTEVLHPREVRSVSRYAGILQIGARNMQDWPLLEAAAETGRPILLKRGMMATVDEWLTAAEYIMIRGNPHVILCERGIRTFEPGTRNTLDLAAAARIKDFSHLPIVVDPSHAAGQRELVPALASAGAAAGADGLMIEVHAHPHRAWSDGRQSITPETFGQIVRQVRALLRALGRAPKENTLES